MDKLDKITIVSVTLMAFYATALLILTNDPSQAEANQKRVQAAQQHVATPELQNKIQLAKNLLTQENLKKSETLVESLLTEYPYEGELYMLKGDILIRRQQPIAAMYEFKEAVLLNPDFLDKKTKLFQGKKIKVTVKEAMAAIEIGLQKDPDDNLLKDARQTLYFMKRKIAGSCG